MTDFICPISYDIIKNPVMTKHNFYDIKNLKMILLKGFFDDPLTREPLVIQAPSVNYLRSLYKFQTENIIEL